MKRSSQPVNRHQPRPGLQLRIRQPPEIRIVSERRYLELWLECGLMDIENLTSFKPLSPRQQELGSLLAAGMANREIARQMKLTYGSVKEYVHIVLLKTGARNRTDLALRWFKGRCAHNRNDAAAAAASNGRRILSLPFTPRDTTLLRHDRIFSDPPSRIGGGLFQSWPAGLVCSAGRGLVPPSAPLQPKPCHAALERCCPRLFAACRSDVK
jgi:DNA-binding CsgD family transcriptional regulator